MSGNKFTASVLQRLEQEQKTQSKPKAQTKTVTNKDIGADKKESIAQKGTEKVSKTQSDFPDMAEYLRVEPQRMAKNKTFYLDVDVIDALTAAARRQKVTDSKLCNDILRRVLGISK